MRTFICYVGSMLNFSSCLSFLFSVVSHHKNLSTPSHPGEPQMTRCQVIAPVHQRKFSFSWFLMYAVGLYVTVLFVSLNRRGTSLVSSAVCSTSSRSCWTEPDSTHLNQGLHICGTEIIAIQYIYERNDYGLMETHAINSLVLSITTVLQCASLYCLYFISFLMFWQGKTNILPHFTSKTCCRLQTSPVPLVELKSGKPLSLYC